MSTDVTVKTQLQSLIDKSNAATGNSDTDLTTAVDSLVAGYGQGAGEDYGLQLMTKTIEEIPQSWTDNVLAIDMYQFRNCVNLKVADFQKATSLERWGFIGCTSLEEAILPNVSYAVTMSHQGSHFEGCISLVKVHLPKLNSFGAEFFNNCKSLVNVILQSAITIYRNVFLNNIALKIVILPRVEKLAGGTEFSGCTSLDTLVIGASKVCTMANVNAFTNTPIASGTGYVYVPKTLVDSYKVATNWTTYADQIRAIEDYRETLEPIFLEHDYEYDWGDAE